MATISAAKKFRGNLLDRPGLPIVTIGTGFTVLNSDLLTVTDGTASDILKIMGDAGALESDIQTNGGDVIRQTVPSGSRYLDLFGLSVGNTETPGDFSTAPKVRVYGKIGGPGDNADPSPTPTHLVTDFDSSFPTPDSWWLPLVDENGANEITLPTELAIMGEDSGGYVYGLTAPKYVRVAGVNEIACVVTTAGQQSGSPDTGTAYLLGRYTT